MWARAGKYKLGARVGKYKFGTMTRPKTGDQARARTGGQTKGGGSGNTNTFNITSLDLLIHYPLVQDDFVK